MKDNSSTYSFTEFRPENLTAVDIFALLHQQVFTEMGQSGWNTQDIISILNSKTMHAYLLHKKNDPIGFAMFQCVADEAEIITLGIAPNHQKKGRGQILLNQILSKLHLLKVKKLFLEVREDNTKAIKLYQVFNFQKTGTRSKYYRTQNGKLIDALTFELKI
jgi:ribosomal-protein-alanine N-acetyltransferase